MPYTINSPNLPSNIKKMKKSLREAWITAWNYAFKRFKNEGRAFEYANVDKITYEI